MEQDCTLLKICKGVNVSKGIAIGKVYIYKPFVPCILDTSLNKDEIPSEIAKFKKGQENAVKEIDDLIDRLSKQNDDKVDIFGAHKMMIIDPEMTDEIINEIHKFNTAQKSVDIIIKSYMEMMLNNDSELMRERAYDLKDIENRILRCMEGIPESNLCCLNEPVIVVSHDLCPSDTATLNKKMVKGIITEVGGQTSHSAIIARSYGIPAVLGVKDIMNYVQEGKNVILDAIKGEVITSFDDSLIPIYEHKRAQFIEMSKEIKTYIDKSPRTKDGTLISVNLNLASTKIEDLEYSKYVDGCGLFRTEFIFMGRKMLPSEDEQFEIYKKVLLSFKGRVTIRTLDIGGDKKLDSMELPKEENPFLGERALRLCLNHIDLFKTQLRAILKASIFGKCNVMFPMVGTMDDVNSAYKVVNEVKQELINEKISFDENIKVGVMIEIPSIGLISDIVSKHVDFASIGTNDLCQYSLAVDRMNPNVSQYYQMYNPSVLRLIRYIVQEFNKNHKVISVCGEMGGNYLTAAVLIGFGMRVLSMSGSNIASVKKMIVNNSIEDLENISEHIINLETSDEIEEYIKKNLK